VHGGVHNREHHGLGDLNIDNQTIQIQNGYTPFVFDAGSLGQKIRVGHGKWGGGISFIILKSRVKGIEGLNGQCEHAFRAFF
jgi:hypothetical protein